jgi:hypothetical protein
MQDEALRRICVLYSRFLALSQSDCVLVFVTQFLQCIQCSDKECKWIGCLISFWPELDRLTAAQLEKLELTQYIPPVARDPQRIIFSRVGIDPLIAMLRHEIVKLFIIKAPNLLVHYIRSARAYPFFFVEQLGWILASWEDINLKLFIMADFVRDVTEIGLMLQQAQLSPEVATARNISFLFLFKLLHSACFDLPVFVDGFFPYLFESPISTFILIMIRDICAAVNGRNCLAAIRFFKLSLLQCALRAGDDRYGFLALGICQLICYLRNRNEALLPSFCILFNPLMACLPVFPSFLFFSNVLDLISLFPFSSISSGHLDTIFTFVKPNFVQNLSVFYHLFRLIAGTEKWDFRVPCIIHRPVFLQLLFACYGESPFMHTILEILPNWTHASLINSVRCHEGDVDLFLLEILSADSETVSLFHNGLTIVMTVSFDDQESLVIPLLVSIASYSSSYSIAAKFVDAASKGNLRVLRVLARIVSSLRIISRPVFEMRPISPNPVITGLHGRHFGDSFTLSFWFRIDALACEFIPAELTLVSVTARKNMPSLSLFHKDLSRPSFPSELRVALLWHSSALIPAYGTFAF